jgi:tetratricopeptide (TPR) repeat protein
MEVNELLSPGERRTFDISLLSVTSRSVVTWQFSCESFDVSVSIHLLRSNSSSVVLPPLRITTISGSFILDHTTESATSSLRFTVDNSFSMLRGKVVTATACVLPSTLELEKRASRLIDPENVDEVNIAANEGQSLFMTNNYHLAEEMFSREKDRIAIFALCYATVAWLRAMMTMSTEEVKTARSKLSLAELVAESCIISCNSRAAKLEAEIVLAELQLLQGVLSLLEESVVGLVNCALSVRSAFLKYARVNKEAFEGRIGVVSGSIVDDNDYTKELDEVSVLDISTAKLPLPELSHVLSGLQFGLGTFNLVSSVLPPFILRLLSIAGFPSNRQIGFSCLRACLKGGGVRFPLASMNLLGMRIIFPSFHSGADIPSYAREGSRIVEGTLLRLHDSALFLWFKGRLERMQLMHSQSALSFEKCALETRDHGLPQLAQLADYEGVFLALFTGNFETMLKLSESLERDNSWSVTTYAFLQGVALLELGRAADARAMFSHLLRLSLKRLAGRIVAAEQWAVKRAAEFVAHSTSDEDDKDATHEGITFRVKVKNMDRNASFTNDLYPSTLLGLETAYFWGGFQQMTNERLEEAVQRSDKVLKDLANGRLYDLENKQDSQMSKNDTNNPTTTELLSTAAKVTLPNGIDQNSEEGSTTMLGALMSSLSFMGSSSATSGTSGSTLMAGTSKFASVSQIHPVHIAAVSALIKGAASISLGNIDTALESLEWVISESSRLWSREAHIVAYSMYELGTLYLILSRYKTLKNSSMNNESIQNRKIGASRLSQTMSIANAKTQAMKYFKMASSISMDFNWKVRLAIRIHLAIGDLDEMGECT